MTSAMNWATRIVYDGLKNDRNIHPRAYAFYADRALAAHDLESYVTRKMEEQAHYPPVDSLLGQFIIMNLEMVDWHQIIETWKEEEQDRNGKTDSI